LRNWGSEHCWLEQSILAKAFRGELVAQEGMNSEKWPLTDKGLLNEIGYNRKYNLES